MPSRFTQYGGVAGAEGALREIVAQRYQAQLEEQKQRQQEIENAMRAHTLRQSDERIGLDANAMEYRQGRDKAGDEASAAKQEAIKGFIRTAPAHMQAPLQSRELGLGEHSPHDFEAPEAHQAHVAKEEADKRATGLQDFEQREQIRASHRPQPQAPKSTADELKEFEAKEQIKAKYGGSKPSLGAERQALSYFNRAKQATEDIGDMEETIAKMSLVGQARLQAAPNFLQTEENQRYRQGQRAFTEARLRKESGAAIPQGEYDTDAKTYFAQPGDTPPVIAQKRRARSVVLDGLKFASGKAYDEFYGQQQQQPSAPPMIARNPKTGETLMSDDGGKSWHK